MIRTSKKPLIAFLLSASLLIPLPSMAVAPPEMKQEAAANIDAHAKLVQVMVDTVFSLWRAGFPGIQDG